MRRVALLTAAACLVLRSRAAVAAQPVPAEFDAIKTSGEIAADLARRDVDAFAADAGKYMVPSTGEKLKDIFQFISHLGKSQYTDLVYSREYGRTGKDVIYKIDFEKAFLFARFLWEVDNGKWRLIQLNAKTENELPFPGSWRHIYPQ
jgi:hypothetical protein